MKFTNLLEGVPEGQRLARAMVLLEQVRTGSVQLSMGVLRESIGSDEFDSLTLDAMHKRALKGYMGFPGEGAWREFCEVNPNVPDFRPQNAIRLGSFAGLSKIPEGGRYKIRKPDDEHTSYLVEVYGDMEAYTLQAMANDELRMLGKWGMRFGSSAVRQLHSFVFNELLDANPTVGYDSKALFHADHNNDLGTGKPLNYANLKALRKLIRNQTGLAGEPLNLEPTILIVHPDEEEEANRLVGAKNVIVGAHDAAASGTTFESNDNFHRGRYMIIVTPYITSGRYFLACPPSQCDTIEVGFFGGKEVPDVMMEMANTGYEFETDSRRVKGRYIFGGTPVDHRWVARAAA